MLIRNSCEAAARDDIFSCGMQSRDCLLSCPGAYEGRESTQSASASNAVRLREQYRRAAEEKATSAERQKELVEQQKLAAENERVKRAAILTQEREAGFRGLKWGSSAELAKQRYPSLSSTFDVKDTLGSLPAKLHFNFIVNRLSSVSATLECPEGEECYLKMKDALSAKFGPAVSGSNAEVWLEPGSTIRLLPLEGRTLKLVYESNLERASDDARRVDDL